MCDFSFYSVEIPGERCSEESAAINIVNSRSKKTVESTFVLHQWTNKLLIWITYVEKKTKDVRRYKNSWLKIQRRIQWKEKIKQNSQKDTSHTYTHTHLFGNCCGKVWISVFMVFLVLLSSSIFSFFSLFPVDKIQIEGNRK